MRARVGGCGCVEGARGMSGVPLCVCITGTVFRFLKCSECSLPHFLLTDSNISFCVCVCFSCLMVFVNLICKEFKVFKWHIVYADISLYRKWMSVLCSVCNIATSSIRFSEFQKTSTHQYNSKSVLTGLGLPSAWASASCISSHLLHSIIIHPHPSSR